MTNSLAFDFAGVAQTLEALRERMNVFEAELPPGIAGMTPSLTLLALRIIKR